MMTLFLTSDIHFMSDHLSFFPLRSRGISAHDSQQSFTLLFVPFKFRLRLETLPFTVPNDSPVMI